MQSKLKVSIDEDVDDLDDVLDQFSPNPIPAPPPTSTLGLPPVGRPRQNTRVDAAPPSLPGSSGSKLTEDLSEDELSKAFETELARGMEALMKELGEESSTGKDGKLSDEEKRKALKAWETMFFEGMEANSGAGGQTQTRPDNEKKGGVDFKTRLKDAVDNLKESESKLQGGTSDAGAGATPDSIEALLASLGEGDPEEFGDFLEKMMNQLLSKEVLQEPLRELSNGFPGYLANPPSVLSEEDRERYAKQQVCISKILEVFDKPDYRDDHQEYSKQIMEFMSELQSYGSPPSEIMGDLPPGLDKIDEKDCVIS